MLQFILNRFREPSSWFGLMLIGSAFGMDLTETQQNAIMYFGMAMCAAPDVKLDEIIKRKKAK